MKAHTLLFLGLASLSISSCKKAPVVEHQECDLAMQDRGVSSDEPTDPGTAKPCRIPEREPGANLVYNISTSDFSEEQEKKMAQALERLEIVINSQEFKQRVLDHTYNGSKTFANNNGLTNEQIYAKIMEGAETLQPEIDEEMDLDITMYYRSNSTVGYTYPNTNRIWVNSKFFNGYNLGQVAANVTHEWTHKLGFGHDSRSTARRAYSVPYGIGKIIRELIESM